MIAGRHTLGRNLILVLAAGMTCLAGISAAGEGNIVIRGRDERPPAKAAATQTDVARAAEEIASANEAAKAATAELARAAAAERAAVASLLVARAAAEQARAAAEQAEAAAFQADEDAAPQAYALAWQARAYATQQAHVAEVAAAACQGAAAVRAGAERSVAQAAGHQAAATKAYGTLSLALMADEIRSGEAAMKSGDYSAAQERLSSALAMPLVDGAAELAGRARSLLSEMEQIAADKLDAAKLRKLQGDESGALEIIRQVTGQLPFTKAAGEARSLLADPRTAANADLLAAEALDRAGRYAEAMAGYRGIVKSFPESVPALKAKLRLAAMEKDPAIAAELKAESSKAAEAACPGWLAMARNYLDNERPDLARDQLQKILARFPESEYAKQAAVVLKEIESAGREESKS
jgi:hypothetical protein